MHTKAQNLVYNGNFEVYSQCPTGTSSQSNMQLNNSTGWYASALSPDYFNACAGVGSNVDVPYSGHGYQQDCCGGGGYVGEYMLDANDANNSDREYIYTKLIDTLKAGHKYLASMYVSRANFNYSIATIGMLFTDTVITLPWPQSFINANPQVKNTTLLTDTANWVLIEDTVAAIGNETYLTIGNFNTSATSDSVKSLGSNWWYYYSAYYYIDGVSVYDLETVGVKQNKNVEINIFPNPANTVLQLTVNNEHLAVSSLYNTLGEQVLTTKQKEIDVSGLPNGIYFLEVKTAEGVLSKKIIVQH